VPRKKKKKKKKKNADLFANTADGEGERHCSVAENDTL
jgi:hypothetical protein